LAPSTKLDYESLVALWKKVVERNEKAILLLAGSIVTFPDHIEYPHRLRILCRELGISDNVLVIGNPYDLWREAKTSLMSAADVFVHTTKGVEETSSLVVLEAMAHGLPAIVSDWSGLSEIVDDGKNGFVVDTLSSSVLPSLTQTFSSRLSSNYNGKLEGHVAIYPKQLLECALLLAGNGQTRIAMSKQARLKICNSFSIQHVVRQRLGFFDAVSREAQKEWEAHRELYSTPEPLIDVGLVTKELSSKTILPSTRLRLGDPSMLLFVPENQDDDFREMSQKVVLALNDNGELSGSQIMEFIYEAQSIGKEAEYAWPYLGLVITRLLSYWVIEPASM